MIELDEGPRVVLAKKEHVDWGQEVVVPLEIEPEFGRIERGHGGERFALVGFAELNVDPPAVRHPAGDGRLTPKPGVGVFDALVVFDPVLVLQGLVVPGLGAARRPR